MRLRAPRRSTKLHIPLRKKRAALLLPVFFAVLPASAQFNPKSQATRVETVTIGDTLMTQALQPTTRIRVDLYSDAYDQYIRRLRSKQRNSYVITPGLNITQASFSNWQKGGDNSFAGLATLNIEHNYKAPVFSIKTVFDAKYGIMRTNSQTRKNIDYFNFSTTPSWNISERWKLSSSLIWKSQFTNSYDYGTDPKTWKSTFMSPGTIELSGGFTYESANKNLNILLSPIAGKLTIVLNDSLARIGGFGIDPETENRHFKAEIGASARINYKVKFYKEKIEYITKLETFWNYNNSPNILLDNTFNFKFTNVFSATFFAQMIYDDQIETPRVRDAMEGGREIKKWRYFQVYQTLGFGLTFKIASKPHKPIEESTITKTRLRYRN